jgi:hypothetical protein
VLAVLVLVRRESMTDPDVHADLADGGRQQVQRDQRRLDA